MGGLPDEAYIALEALKNGWSLLALDMGFGNQDRYEGVLTETEEQMRASESWTSLIQDEWGKGNGNRIEADNAWLESVFDAPGSRNSDTFDSGDW
ncbi:MAG: hypothetical protein WA056_10585 [Gallionella sp.]